MHLPRLPQPNRPRLHKPNLLRRPHTRHITRPRPRDNLLDTKVVPEVAQHFAPRFGGVPLARVLVKHQPAHVGRDAGGAVREGYDADHGRGVGGSYVNVVDCDASGGGAGAEGGWEEAGVAETQDVGVGVDAVVAHVGDGDGVVHAC